MGEGDKLQSKAYTRYLSENIRKWSPKPGPRFVEEDPIIGGVSGLARVVMLTVCRNRQRLLQQAWDYWTEKTECNHDYAKDVRAILCHPLPHTQMRSELEIEIIYKWVRQNALHDVTGIAASLYACSSKKVIVQCLQMMRLESYMPGDAILFQGALPRPEDGHFTILEGECDVLQFPEESISYVKQQQMVKRSMYEALRKHLLDNTVLATLKANAGFGELSSLTGVKRAVTVRAGLANKGLTDVIVIPKHAFVDCLEHRNGSLGIDEDSAPSEAIELFRQTGLAARINPQELVAAAGSMRKVTLTAGDILYMKGEPATRLYLVVSGDVVLDLKDPVPYKAPGKPGKGLLEPFLTSNEEHVFHMSGGSILGDEGILGLNNTYVASCAVASDYAVVFEAVGFAKKFLFDRVKAMRYAALTYKELPRWTVPVDVAEKNNLYGTLNSLRRVVAVCNPSRGVHRNWHISDEDLTARHHQAIAPTVRAIQKRRAIMSKNNSKKDGIAADGDKEKEAAVAAKKKKEEEERKREAAKSKRVEEERRKNMKKRGKRRSDDAHVLETELSGTQRATC